MRQSDFSFNQCDMSDPSTSVGEWPPASVGESVPSTSEAENDPSTSEARPRERDPSLPVRQRETPLRVRQRKTPLYQWGMEKPSLQWGEIDPSLPVRVIPLQVRQSDPFTSEAERDPSPQVRLSDPSIQVWERVTHGYSLGINFLFAAHALVIRPCSH